MPETTPVETPSLLERLYPAPLPTVGLVVGTYGSVPYVHLQLDSWRRNYGHIPLLVHDDASPEEDALRGLCTRYGADFSRNNQPHGHFAGDMTVFAAGMHWAQRRRLDILAKFSRRFIPRLEWVTELQTLAYVTQYATFSNAAQDVGFGFRTECTALHLDSWLAAGMLEAIEQVARETCGGHVFNEFVMHQYARQIHGGNCLFNKFYEMVHPPLSGREAYAAWPLMGTSRSERLPHVLWHNAYPPFEYYMTARAYGLTEYHAGDFEAVPAAPEVSHD